MTLRRLHKRLALVLIVFVVWAAASPAWGECDSPCCRHSKCKPSNQPTISDICHLIQSPILEMKRASCEMHKLQTADATLAVSQTAQRAGVFMEGVSPFPFCEKRHLSDSYEVSAPRVVFMPRAAPDPLYLQHLTLLI